MTVRLVGAGGRNEGSNAPIDGGFVLNVPLKSVVISEIATPLPTTALDPEAGAIFPKPKGW